jgi:hypothetical protein
MLMFVEIRFYGQVIHWSEGLKLNVFPNLNIISVKLHHLIDQYKDY